MIIETKHQMQSNPVSPCPLAILHGVEDKHDSKNATCFAIAFNEIQLCANHVQTVFKPCSNQMSIKVNCVGRGPGLPATVLKPCLISEIGRSPSLLEAIVNQLRCTCFCVNVGRGPGLPETMLKPCLITEIGRCQSPLEAIAHTRTHASTRTPKPTSAHTPSPTLTPVLAPTPTPTQRGLLSCGFRHQRTRELRN